MVHGILQARILEWVASPFSRDLPNPGIKPRFPALQVNSLPAEPSPGEGEGYPLQYSGLENSMDHILHGVAKSQTRLSDFHFHWVLWILWKLGDRDGLTGMNGMWVFSFL